MSGGRWAAHPRLRAVLIVAGLLASVTSCTSAPSDQSVDPGTPAASSAPADPNSGPLTLISTAFSTDDLIPISYSCTGSDTSPPLSWPGAAPPDTKSWAVVMQDLDVQPGPWIDWLITGIDSQTRTLAAGESPVGSTTVPASNGSTGFVGVCPPTGQTHHYQFTVYALGAATVPDPADTQKAFQAIQAGALAAVTLTGRFAR